MPARSPRTGPRRVFRLAAAAALLAAACTAPRTAVRAVAVRPPPPSEEGLASWYGEPYHGRATASGTPFDMHALTAAHRTLPFGSSVRVINLLNGRSLVVTINDRGPFVEGRIIDLSYGAAQLLDAVGPGVIPVRLEVLATGDGMLGETCWEVQVGAFSEPANVERAVATLRRLELSSRTVPAPQGLTRVRVTSIASRDEATRVAARLRATFPGASPVPCGATR